MFFNGSRVNISVSQSLHRKEVGTAQMDEGNAAARERDLELDVIEHIAGRLKLVMDRCVSN